MTEFQARYAPSLRELLIGLARQGGEKITYSGAAEILGVWHRIQSLLSAVGHECQARGEPILTALVVSKQTGECSEGLEAEFGITDPAAERLRCAEWWAEHPDEPTDDVGRRAVRFGLAKTRPDQRAFRRALFERYGGRCAITGCQIDGILEAAHLPGRSWEAGHNDAEDGVLLRIDIHRLVDRGHMQLLSDGSVGFDEKSVAEYGDYSGSSWLP